MEQLHQTTEILSGLSFEQLDTKRIKAFALNDVEALEAIYEEAIHRNYLNLDKTIVQWRNLVKDCGEGIKLLSAHYG